MLLVTIVGTGNMARAIGARMVAGGESVTLLGKDESDSEELARILRSGTAGDATVKSGVTGGPISGEVVILAIYYPDALEFVRNNADHLAGRIVVDISNPLNATFDELATPPDSSAAEELARLAPRARFVKAFNTIFAGTLIAGEVAGQQLDVFIAGDDEEARRTISRLVSNGGLNPVDVGPLKRARQLEQMGFLLISIQQPLGLGSMSGWKLLRPTRS